MDYKSLVEKMTLEEKAGMCSGMDFWHTKAVERLGIPSVMVSDGPHGLRKQAGEVDHLGLNESIDAVCFPAACATACTFDRDLMYQMGVILGKECQAEDVSVLLGPAINIKRSPLCGRNFEYISEDPYLAGELSASYINGVQSQHVGTSIKHFAANNQEHERMIGSSEVDERTLREIYLPGFETAVKKAQPWSVMCSYNKVNGVFASENRMLLNDILKEEWGFEGFVVSDWSAVNDRVEGIRAGLELEMPGCNGSNDREIVKAVLEGKLEEAVLDDAVERILKVIFKYVRNRQNEIYDREVDHQKAVKIAKECIVLLKNENVLPLKKDEKIAFIGGFAKIPRYQGGGSSHINAHHVTSAVESAAAYADIVYAKGFSTAEDVVDEKMQAEAVQAAKNADCAVIFAGLPDTFESEGYDRTHMQLPVCQTKLINEVCKVQKHVIVVLHNGSPVEMPWVNQVQGIVEVYLGGEGIGEATASILFGVDNPCGKLAETFPLKLEDNPSYLNFPGTGKKVEYKEGIFVGYRYYDTKKMEVLFPFGYGLSYTTYEYSNLKLSSRKLKDTETMVVSVDVTNTGNLAGKEIVQLYVKDTTGVAIRPEKELKNFAVVSLNPGETKTVEMKLDKRSFAWYDVNRKDWYAATGEYVIAIGKSSRDIVLSEKIMIISTMEQPWMIDENTMIGELLADGRTEEYTKKYILPLAPGLVRVSDLDAIVHYLPIRALRSFGEVDNKKVAEILSGLRAILKY